MPRAVRWRGMKRMLFWACLLLPLFPLHGADPDDLEADPRDIGRTAADLFKRDEFGELDRLAGDLKKKGFDIREARPGLHAFYESFDLEASAPERDWLDQQGKLNTWIRDRPDSLAAKIALAKWYIDYGWKARGISEADQVTPEGWKLMGERLRQASALLKSVPEPQIDDPEYYRLWIILEAQPDNQNTGSGRTAFDKGVNLTREYYPLYVTRAYFLLPKWFGQPGDTERFILNSANGLPGEKGDILYARLARAEARQYDLSFFKQTHLDYPRIKRGFLAAAASEPADRARRADQSNLCYLAAIQGDRETASRLFLDLGNTIQTQAFGTDEILRQLRRECGADAALQNATNLEWTGQIDQAEKIWIAFHPDAATSPWLAGFYLRQGIAAKLRDLAFKSKTYGMLLDTDPSTASPDTLAELAKIAPQVGDWEKAEAAARGFDQKRPFNLIGKNTLWLCALHAGDNAQAEAVRRDVLALQTKRPAYLTAQAVIAGTKTWNQARSELNPRDEYLTQGIAAIALHYYTEGQPEAARKALAEAIPLCRDRPEKTLLESMLYGSLGRWLNPPAAPPPAQ